MAKSTAQGVIDEIALAFQEFPDERQPGNNRKSSVSDAAFSVFFTQSPSFLSFQRTLERRAGRSNVHSLFGIPHPPTDVRIRNILDPVSPRHVAPLIQRVGEVLREHNFTCKPSSHCPIAEWVEGLERTPTLETFEVVLETSQGKPRGKRRPKVVRERWAFRFLEAVPPSGYRRCPVGSRHPFFSLRSPRVNRLFPR
ncbi:MAG: hypothetical protein ACP5OP_00130 [Leptospirillia bacterium]